MKNSSKKTASKTAKNSNAKTAKVENAKANLPEKLENLVDNAEVTEVTEETTESLLNGIFQPIAPELRGIEQETFAIVQSQFEYNKNCAIKLGNIRKWFQSFSAERKVYHIHFNGKLVDLCAAKTNTKKAIMGFWDFLQFAGFVPFGAQASYKLLRQFDNISLLNKLTKDQIIELGLNDKNKVDSLLKLHSKNQKDAPKGETVEILETANEFAGILEEKASQPASNKTQRDDFTLSVEKKAIKISYKTEDFKAGKQAVKVAILNFLLAELGPQALTATNIARINDNAKETAK